MRPFVATILLAAWMWDCAFAEVPPSPFGTPPPPPGRWGSVLLVGGEKKEETLTGAISFTYGKVIQLHDADRKDLSSIKPSDVAAMDVAVEKETIEEEWTWKEMGSDEKIKTGRTYPDRKYIFTITLRDGRRVRGYIIGTPVYVVNKEGKTRRVVLRTHQRGDFGQKADELVYVARIAFHSEDTPPPWPVRKEETETREGETVPESGRQPPADGQNAGKPARPPGVAVLPGAETERKK
ncbi:MAG TPA: hypothetical protein ENN09_04950 [Planctomycetes bacterium]|nr:hypothetical protein [Planctomycetota bacterium]